MSSDRSRGTIGPSLEYKAVVMQQGRVTLDGDFNTLQEIVDNRIAADTLSLVGPCGTPDDGFAISLHGRYYPLFETFSHRRTVAPDFLIGPGTMYLGGQRVVLPVPASNQTWSYFNQPDWRSPDDPGTSGSIPYSIPSSELVYLEVLEVEVGAVEDPDLLEIALGGPDTTQRLRLQRRIKRMPVTGDDCSGALIQAVAAWTALGYGFDPSTMRLTPLAKLVVGFTSTTSTSNPCDPTASGGYLGAENQLIRVQVCTPTATGLTQILWSYDNASFMYRATLGPDGQTLTLQQPPVDAYHNPKVSQYVELLRTATVLESPGSGQSVVRCIAEETGLVAPITFYSGDDNTLRMGADLSAYVNETNPLFVRIWINRQPVNLVTPAPVALTDPLGTATPGITVTLSVPSTGATGAGSALPVGAYWTFAVRPGSPQIVYPERYGNTAQPADGSRRWACPLAVIDWPVYESFSSPDSSSTTCPPVHDCRHHFRSLLALSQGCCSSTVRPSDAPRLQQILDDAACCGGPATICFTSGTYLLPGTLRLTARHVGAVLEACQGGVVIQADPQANPSSFADGLIVLAYADRVTLRGLHLILSGSPVGSNVDLEDLAPLLSVPDPLWTMIGLRLVQSQGVLIENCQFDLSARDSLNLFGAGVFATADCSGLTVKGSQFSSQTPPSVTPKTAIINSFNATTPFNPALSSSGTSLIHTEAIILPREVVALSSPPATSPPTGSPPSSVGFLPLAVAPDIGGGVNPLPVRIRTDLAALYGVLAIGGLTQTNAGTTAARPASIVPVLQQARISDNDFSNLSFALACRAHLGAMEVRDNRVSSCFGGILIEDYNFVPGNVLLSGVLSNYEFWGNLETAILGYVEFTAADVLGYNLPLPSGVDPVALTKLLASEPASGPVSVAVTNNRVVALLPNLSTQAGSALALLLALSNPNTNSNTLPAGPTVICSSNEFRSGIPNVAGFGSPVAVLAVDGPTTMTGNVIVSTTSSELRICLAIIPGTTMTSQHLAVTGNVLIGRSNLLNLARAEFSTAPFNIWVPFNAS